MLVFHQPFHQVVSCTQQLSREVLASLLRGTKCQVGCSWCNCHNYWRGHHISTTGTSIHDNIMLLEELQADLKAMAFGNTGAWLVRMTVRWLSEHSSALLYRLSMHHHCWTTSKNVNTKQHVVFSIWNWNNWRVSPQTWFCGTVVMRNRFMGRPAVKVMTGRAGGT